MCECVDVEIGSYDNQEIVKIPKELNVKYNNPDRMSKTEVCIDKCLVKEIKYLWSLGIVTTGCCCGHNRNLSYIGVADKYIPKMIDMGYRVRYNPCRPEDRDSFIPKSID